MELIHVEFSKYTTLYSWYLEIKRKKNFSGKLLSCFRHRIPPKLAFYTVSEAVCSEIQIQTS